MHIFLPNQLARAVCLLSFSFPLSPQQPHLQSSYCLCPDPTSTPPPSPFPSFPLSFFCYRSRFRSLLLVDFVPILKHSRRSYLTTPMLFGLDAVTSIPVSFVELAVTQAPNPAAISNQCRSKHHKTPIPQPWRALPRSPSRGRLLHTRMSGAVVLLACTKEFRTKLAGYRAVGGESLQKHVVYI